MIGSHQITRTTYSLFNLQVSGKAPKLVSADNKIIYKCYIDLQSQFYEYVNNFIDVSNPQYSIKKYLPGYKGKIILSQKPEIEYRQDDKNKQISIWLQHVKNRYDKKNEGNKFIMMENFLQSYKKPNILDIKIGGRQQKPHKITNSVQLYKIKLNGMIKTNAKGEFQFISKYIMNKVQDFSEISKFIAHFFNFQEKLLNNLLVKIEDQLKGLVLAVRSMRGWKFVSTSICIIYDSENLSKVELKYIDFGRALRYQLNEGYDDETSQGLQFIIQSIKLIRQNSQKFDNIKIQKQGTVVPDSKIKKFESNRQSQGNGKSN